MVYTFPESYTSTTPLEDPRLIERRRLTASDASGDHAAIPIEEEKREFLVCLSSLTRADLSGHSPCARLVAKLPDCASTFLDWALGTVRRTCSRSSEVGSSRSQVLGDEPLSLRPLSGRLLALGGRLKSSPDERRRSRREAQQYGSCDPDRGVGQHWESRRRPLRSLGCGRWKRLSRNRRSSLRHPQFPSRGEDADIIDWSSSCKEQQCKLGSPKGGQEA